MTLLKRTYAILSMVAIVHLLALAGGVGFLVATGELDSVRAAEVIDIFRRGDEELQSDVEESTEEAASVGAIGQSVESIERQHHEGELVWRAFQRHQAELDQRLEAIQLQFLEQERNREEFERYRKSIVEQQNARQEIDQSRGFKKELELFAQMKSANALEFLLAKQPEDAAHLLLELPSRSARKIIESAKTAEKRSKINTILQLMGEVAPEELRDAESRRP